MCEKTNPEHKKLPTGVLIIAILLVIGIVTLAWYDLQCAIKDAEDNQIIFVEGEIISAEFLGNPKGEAHYDIFNLTFDNNESYLIKCKEDTDFTVNSKFVIKLWRDNPAEKYWTIIRMYRCPSEGDT